MTPRIYTIGYQALAGPGILSDLALRLDATVVDVRARPFSRKPGFGRRQLEFSLGARYTWLGDQLGGIPRSAQGDVRAQLAALSSGDQWNGGIAWIAAARGPLVLLCQEEAPGDCHRHKIALRLSGPVAHIYRGQAASTPWPRNLSVIHRIKATRSKSFSKK